MSNFFNLLMLGIMASMPDSRTVTVLIDTGLSTSSENIKYLCADKIYDLTSTTIRDNRQHGTLMFDAIKKDTDHTKNCIAIIKYCDTCRPTEKGIYSNIYKALKLVLDMPNVKYVNMSLTANYDYSDEKQLFEELISRGVVFSIAAGNDHLDLDLMCDRYPACYFHKHPQFHVLGALNEQTNAKESYSNYGSYVTEWEVVPPRGGTSSAAARFTNKLIRGIAK